MDDGESYPFITRKDGRVRAAVARTHDKLNRCINLVGLIQKVYPREIEQKLTTEKNCRNEEPRFIIVRDEDLTEVVNGC